MEKDLGYLSEIYANAFAEFGIPVRLESAGSWILQRSIPGTDYCDGMGLYPLMCCKDWLKLKADFEELHNLVSFVCVVDPASAINWGDLLDVCSFGFVKVYKEHVVANPRSPSISKHHMYYAKRALEKVEVEVARRPLAYFGDWCALYSELIERRAITGIQMFSYESFKWQFKTPGLVVFVAKYHGRVVGMHLWFEQGNVAYSHLAASSTEGYELMAAYALHKKAIEHFRDKGVGLLDLGAGAGVHGESNGLAWFKKGWSPDTRPAYLCGKVFKQNVYDALGNGDGDFFPAYRKPNG